MVLSAQSVVHSWNGLIGIHRIEGHVLDWMLNWTTLFLLIAGILAATAWWFIPLRQARKLDSKGGLTAKDIAELEDEYRKTMTQALGGIILLLSATVAFQQLYETRRSSDAQLQEAAKTTDLNNKQQQLAKGFELLGKRSSAEHLGGIRILYDWAETSSKDDSSSEEKRYSIVTPALASFVRDMTKFPIKAETCEEFERPLSETVGNDVQAALDILRKRSTGSPLVLNLRGLNLSRANLSGANLSGSNFAFVDLSEADLSNTKLRNTNFYCANLYRANLAGADLSGETVDDRGPLTNLAGALLLKANLGKADGKANSLARAILVKATLSESFLEETDLRGARLWEANLFRTRLQQVQVDSQTDLDKACLIETKNTGTQLAMTKNFDKVVKFESGNTSDGRSWCAPKRKTDVQTPAAK
jgi:uncharacterized protein YjbI with pentapeptide repeats